MLCIFYFCRIHQRIGMVIQHVKLSNVYMEYHFLIQNNLKNGNMFRKKLLNEIIERLDLNKISSPFMNLVLVRVSSIQKEHIFTINLLNFFVLVEFNLRGFFLLSFFN